MTGMRRPLTASVLLVVAWTGLVAFPASAEAPASKKRIGLRRGYSGLGGTCTQASGQVGVVG
jgi:hypothetical protein